jgi:hypothetical protein
MWMYFLFIPPFLDIFFNLMRITSYRNISREAFLLPSLNQSGAIGFCLSGWILRRIIFTAT